MKSIPKLIKRFIGILLLSSFLLLLLNIVVLIVIGSDQMQNGAPWETAEEAASSMIRLEEGYTMTDSMSRELAQNKIWAVYIDNTTLRVLWQSDNVPDTVPTHYTGSSIAHLTRGYIDDYPTFTGESDDGLMVLGYPRDSFWKHMWPSWDYRMIANFPKILLAIAGVNLLLIFLIYLYANTKLLRSVKPIVTGIESLPSQETFSVPEKGVLSELAVSINETSRVLAAQNLAIQKKDTARANWIAGVSHDIRTPLSMVIGYASQLEADPSLPLDAPKKIQVILRQSEKIKCLIQDLNLASKLEYNMQPLNLKRVNMVSIVRQVVVDFINNDIEANYPIEWATNDSLTTCFVQADCDLMRRAVTNLIQNAINHNPDGCNIKILITKTTDTCTVQISDNGIGASEEDLYELNHRPHYMVCDSATTEQRHGLGLLIVRQILQVHGGQVLLAHSKEGGFLASLTLALIEP